MSELSETVRWWRSQIAVRDEELERLREENAYLHPAMRGAENRRQMWRERAEKAEAERDALKAAIAKLLTAQGRMLDGWAEASNSRRSELWKRLHEEADHIRDILDGAESHADATNPATLGANDTQAANEAQEGPEALGGDA